LSDFIRFREDLEDEEEGVQEEDKWEVEKMAQLQSLTKP
jgi:hypothetical protein